MLFNVTSEQIYDIYKSCYNGPDFLSYSPLQLASNAVLAEVPCINSVAATNYLNVRRMSSTIHARPDSQQNDTVRSAIHALPTSDIGRWEICSNKVRVVEVRRTGTITLNDIVQVIYQKLYSSVLPAYETLTKNYRVLFYTGMYGAALVHVSTHMHLQ